VDAADAAGFLVSNGAERIETIVTEQVEVIGEGAAARQVVTEETEVDRIVVEPPGDDAIAETSLPLKGLLVSPDPRLNSVTLTGTPQTVELATELLAQLDLRQRQVAINVKIVDVNLLNTEDFNTSFSFGVADSFFSVDGGNANFRYGDFRPPTSADVQGSLTRRPTVGNPFGDANTFLDLDETVDVPGTDPGVTIINTITGNITEVPRGTLPFFLREAGVSGDPLLPELQTLSWPKTPLLRLARMKTETSPSTWSQEQLEKSHQHCRLYSSSPMIFSSRSRPRSPTVMPKS
jgi:type IV pilus assembly protein PilQ